MRQSNRTTANAWPEDIVAEAEKLLAKIETARIPGFVRERLASLELMIQMLKDHEWRVPEKESSRVLNALAYFGFTMQIFHDLEAFKSQLDQEHPEILVIDMVDRGGQIQELGLRR